MAMRQQQQSDANKGTTTLGLTCSDGVVMGTEMRATMGNLISHKETQKLYEITDRIGFTVAGLVGDAQSLARFLRAEVNLYELQRGNNITVKAASTLLANLLNQHKFFPYMVQLLVGGVDRDGGHIYSLDAAGGAIQDKFTTTGSGSPFVYGVLEDHYEEDITVDEGLELGVRALSMAIRRDSASGDGIAIASITEDEGFQRLTADEVAGIRDDLGIEGDLETS